MDRSHQQKSALTASMWAMIPMFRVLVVSSLIKHLRDAENDLHPEGSPRL